MSYTRPNYNAADASFYGALEYTRPAYNAASVAFAKAITGNVQWSVTANATFHKERHITGSSVVSVTPQSVFNFNKYELPLVGQVTWNVIPQSSMAFTENAGGRVALIASSNYVTPDGGSVPLLSTDGIWVMALETKATVAATGLLESASVLASESLVTFSAEALLEGSIVDVDESIATLSATGALSGCTVLAVESLPDVDAGVAFETILMAEGEIPPLHGSIIVKAKRAGHIDAIIPMLDVDMVLSVGMDISTTIPALQSDFNVARDWPLFFDADIPTLQGDIQGYWNCPLLIDSNIPEWTVDVYGLSGGDMVIEAAIPELSGELLAMGRAEINIEGEIPAWLGGEIALGGDSSIEAMIPAWNGELSLIPSGFAIEASIPDWTGDIQAKAGEYIQVDGAIPAWGGEIDIASRQSVQIYATIPTLTGNVTVTPRPRISITGSIPALTGQMAIAKSNPALRIEATVPEWAFSGLSNQIAIDARLPLWIGQVEGGIKNPPRFL